MAITNAAVVVNATAVLLSGTETDTASGQVIYLTNGAAALTIGNATVAAGAGLTIAAAANFGPICLGPGEALYGITASTSTVGVTRTGV
jgi:hypothetical protein